MFKKIITALLATIMFLIVLPTKVLAEAPTEQSTENTNDTIDPEDIVDVEVIDGDLYIVVLEESQGYGMTRANRGMSVRNKISISNKNKRGTMEN